MTVKLGLVGFGLGGRYFHAPFITAARGIELAGIVARSPQRISEAHQDFPDVPVFPSLREMVGHVDAVTITTPPATRRSLVMEAISHGLHVVADKPFAPDLDGAQELIAAAENAAVLLGVYQNRRFDADIRTLRSVLPRVGRVWRAESHFDLDGADTLEAGPDGGLLRDMGAHVVDQMVWLFGPAERVYAHLDHVDRPEGRTDASFVIDISHRSGVFSTVSSSKVNHLDARRLRVFGSEGSYVSDGTDVQAQALFAGRRPADDTANWGYEAPERWGTLRTSAGVEAIPSLQGAYQDYYSTFAAAVKGEGTQPVPATEALDTIAILTAARESASSGRAITLG
ncbi:Gfo/Idh/MocA family oxidoreductase [Rhodococcus sp. BP-149]|uniref:Gfo/Idh/MocA family oxidoreductase n=1 Tax=unclassified Rhodococcus (in: high G+C Gram-positive bacteria) TaxID=192944 RepID=UPI001C9ABFCC|nr:MULTISPECIES: Gfo/Idh/MocA family oxidoreductase [unclassified Rhodococcus (in: high G+C Gram-positive bacteria)]MBY6686149.1 Gfo/Idh/MocA family oxidoreductase [Rhodococcus sp. BP-288]MBY6693761.1 Gfo/Idh/MocA family oxidoreductase [Rhodococcus sp. BP-188]MBY6699642.1 Gfo/Idh/MocA family oxidoreductase [Rhodococcus sp. BP-285]MBY6704013.1 Gfo/Idh/MocA family oxidoreductase [Rhodococcus sp. BP-283]MBY6710838.1 Gfo/Idh/MocA family oxidoreductase [Rhodococcus sp. BP-160]